MKKGFYFSCSERHIDSKSGPLCLEQHFYPVSGSFQGYNEIIDATVTFLCCYGERCVFFLLSDVQKASLLKARKSLSEQTFTQKRLVSIRKELFAGQSGRTGLQQNQNRANMWRSEHPLSLL